MKRFWLYLEPYSVIFKSDYNNEILIYNTISNESIKVNRSSKLYEKCVYLLNPENMYFVEVSEKIFKEETCKELVKKIRNTFSGDILMSTNKNQPINFFPMLNLQGDIDRLRLEPDFSIGENIVEYLNEVTVYLNSTCKENCQNCQITFKQYFSCTKNHFNNDLDFRNLFSRILKPGFNNLSKINISGGNIIQYPYIYELIDYLNNFIVIKNYLISLKNTETNIIHSILDNDNNNLTITIDCPSDYLRIKDKLSTISQKKDIEFVFFISNYEEFNISIKLIDDFGIPKSSVIPIYNGGNVTFFKEYVYITEHDILETQINKTQLFSKQALNLNYFGKLFFLSNGDAYSNINSTLLGNIYNSSIKDLIYNELSSRNSWRKIRNQKPCVGCMYQWLCPSPSNYEIAIGKPNLCHVM